MTSLTSQSVLLLLPIVAVLLVVFYGYVLRRDGRQSGKLTLRQIGTLWVLRVGVAILTLIALARPAYQRVEIEERLPVVPLLVDESLSMSFPASRDNALVQTEPRQRRTRFRAATAAAQKLQEKLSRTHRVRVYTFSDSQNLLRELPHREREDDEALTREAIFPEALAPTGAYSNLGDALADTLTQHAGEQLSGIVVLSDGRETGGAPLLAGEGGPGVVEQARAAKVPVHAITFGTEHPLRDLRIDEVIAGAEASHGDVLTLHVKVTNQISNPLETELVLEEKGDQDDASAYKVVARRKLRLDRGQGVFPISTIPETEGLRTYRLTLPEQTDEVNTQNNVAEVSIKVVKRTLKVLLIAGGPSREYFYVVPALLRDPIVDLSCYLQSADVDYVHQGNANVERLPQTVKEWSRYDVAILFDVDPNGISTQQLAGLENMVSNGGGLMVVTGRGHGLAKLVQVHAARIRGLLPVEVDKNLHLDHDRVYEQPFRMRRTVKGRGHPIFLASANATLNEEIFASLEQLDFYWYHPVQAAKPKAIALLETDQPSGPAVLMAIQRYVDGAVFFSAVNSFWRWRYPHESYDYDRLWTRVIRYLGEARLLGTQQQVSLATERRSYSPGEDVQITLRVLDPALMLQLGGTPLFVAVGSDEASRRMTPLTPDPGGESFYRGSYRARRVGTMVIHAQQAAPDADSEAKPLFDVKHSFQVKMQSLEDADTSADLAAMQSLAEQTGGEYYDYHTHGNLEALVEAIPTDPQVLEHVSVEEVWDGTLFLALFLVLVCTELSLRKWWGLL